MKKYVGVMMVVCVFVLVSSVWAAPQKVNFQGKLTNAAGNPFNGSVSMVFTIYDHATSTNSVNKLWTEPQSVTVTNGIYNVLLGKNNPIDTELTEIKLLWLGVKVGTDAEMTPRVELTPGVYDLIGLNAITIKNGNVGINTNDPTLAKLVVNGGVGNTAGIFGNILPLTTIFSYPTLGFNTYYDEHFQVFTGGKYSAIIDLHPGTGTLGFSIGDAPANDGDRVTFSQKVSIQRNGNTSINGTLYVSGADLAEPFDMTDIANLELGDVVVIDPANPLHVTKSTIAYDKTVAGIVSSTKQAGYVAGSRSDGTSDKPIALVGRVLCNVSTENGAIEIGDLLTTSNMSGYAMKATDFPKAHGAIMGKALQAFDGEKGQIMVLVTLQ